VDDLTRPEVEAAVAFLDCAAADVATVAKMLRGDHREWAEEAVALEAKLNILTQWIQFRADSGTS
jgi:hypothetical protein